MSILYPTLGAAVAVAGGDKLIGNRDYQGMFRHLGWSEEKMRAAAVAEVAGGLLMVPRSTRRLGGAIVAAVSAMVLVSELAEGDVQLAGARSLVLCAGLAAMLAPGELKRRR